MADKIESLIGFAVRAGKLIYGIENIEALRKRRYLIVACNSLSERSKSRLIAFARDKNIPLLITKEKLLEDIVHKTKCKAIAFTDRQMSEAVMKYLNDNYEVFTSEVE